MLLRLTWHLHAGTAPRQRYQGLIRQFEEPRTAHDRGVRAQCRGWAQNSKHSIRLPTAASPSRGGAGGPAGWPLDASLFGPPGVERSNWWLMDASVGSPNTASRNFRVEV